MGRPRKLTADDLGSQAWKELRLQILERDGRRCWNCGGHANEVDHIVPRVEGGRAVPSNLRASCATCNRMKSLGEAGRSALRKRAAAGAGAATPPESWPPAWCCSDPTVDCSGSTVPHSQHW